MNLVCVKDEYIQLVIEWRFVNRVRKQMDQVRSMYVAQLDLVCLLFSSLLDLMSWFH